VADQRRPGLGPDRWSLRAPTHEALNKYRRHSFMVGADGSALATAANRKTTSAGLEVRHFAAKGVEGAVCVCPLCRDGCEVLVRGPIRLRTRAEAAPTWQEHGLRQSVAGSPYGVYDYGLL